MTTTASPPETSAYGWTAAMALVRTAAALTAGWSLYVVARHYHVPRPLALTAGLVFDGVAYLCLRSASEAVRAGRSAAGPILATLGMAGVSIYLNLVHAQFTDGGRPAEVLYAAPAIGLLVVSALSWTAERATARAARGEIPMRMPAFGALGWLLAGSKAYDALKGQAEAHVTSSASPEHQTAAPPAARTAEDIIAAEFAELGPATAVQRVAAATPGATVAEIADTLATYKVTITPGQVALLLERAAVPSVTLDRVPQPPAVDEQPALDPARAMRGDAPQVNGMSKADAVMEIAWWLGGSKPSPATIVQHLALQGMATDTAYVRTALHRARKAEEAAATAIDAEAEQQRAEYERRHGNGGYA
ncbi:hypothetical protein ACFVX9_30440 [Kitasatospora sp. NPDC058243]|uniref:hypothetical protein n=1 Tax=Kitasatospora sp. NPDC058243 TaxID=3346397 RepID=UPI0036D76009